MSSLILTCSTGQGHNSCARAIAEYFTSQGESCQIEDALGFISDRVSKAICWGHVTMYRHIHGLFQLGYHYSEKHPGLFEGQSPACRMLSLGVGRLHDYILRNQIDTVVCTHIFASLMMTQVRRRWDLPVVTCLVATDYTVNPGTRESQVDLHFIPDANLEVDFDCPNIRREQMISSGIPVRQMFYRHVPQDLARKKLGIPVPCRHLLMMCGSMGCGPMRQLASLLETQLPKDCVVTIVCGTNKALLKDLRSKYDHNPRIRILGYVQDMSLLMDSADLYLTKPGGISVTEASVKNLPMVLVDAVAGCEQYNKLFFIRRGGARTGQTNRELVRVCAELLTDPHKLGAMRKSLEALPKTNSAAAIYENLQKLRRTQNEENSCALR